ncbi:MAG: o-succinylbenzoate--CoA ligase [bacterium]|nr:o-succinylbenzoate--CoA ligase [bacterium]
MADFAVELVTRERHFSAEESARHVGVVAANLQRRSIPPGERVALLARPTSLTVFAILGLLRSGLIVFPLNPKLPQSVQRDLMARFACKAVIVEAAESDRFPNIETISAESLLSESSAVAVASDLSENRPAVIVATSGSTGQPKGVLLTYDNLRFNALGSNENLPFWRDDRWLLSLPLFHVGGLGILFRAMVGSGCVAIPEDGETLVESCARLSVTHLSLVPTQLLRLLDDLESTGSRMQGLKAILLGGSPLPADLVARTRTHHLPIFTSYGMTEMGSQVTTTKPGEPSDKLMTSGRILRYREIRVDGSGEILVRGETLFAGYLTEKGHELPLDADGWFHTGDIGSIDSDGYLTVVGRRDNMFISGGENIYPEEIEAVIRECQGVEEVVVVPVRSVQWGDRPAAFIRMTTGSKIDISLLKDVMSERLPKYKFPEHFLEWPTDLQSSLKPSRPYFAALAREMIRRLPQ